jgi:hypothetical protein
MRNVGSKATNDQNQDRNTDPVQLVEHVGGREQEKANRTKENQSKHTAPVGEACDEAEGDEDLDRPNCQANTIGCQAHVRHEQCRLHGGVYKRDGCLDG